MFDKKIFFFLIVFCFMFELNSISVCQDIPCKMPGYMTIRDHEGNDVPGPLYGGIQILSFNHYVRLPYDVESNKIQGILRISTLSVTKPIDKVSPLLYEHLCNGSNLREVAITFVRRNTDTPKLEEYYQYFMENVNIVSISANTVEPYDNIETLYFLPSRITWTYPEGGISYASQYQYERFEHSEKDIISKIQMKDTSDTKIKMFFWDSNNIIVEGASDDSSSLLHDYKHKVYLPVDPESGRVSGSRRIGAVFVTKNIDRLSPIQKEILCEGKKISKIQLSFYKYNENKKSEVEYYQVILEDAIMILDSACVVRNTIADSIFYGFHETLGFVAHKFTWRDLESGIEYTEEQPEMNVFTQNNENDNGRFQLCNYPNPFNDRTNILFSVPSILQQEKINISVFDARGRLVKELFNTISEQNHVNVYWDGTNRFNNVVSSGVYFYRISAGHDAQTGKLTFIK